MEQYLPDRGGSARAFAAFAASLTQIMESAQGAAGGRLLYIWSREASNAANT